MKLIKTVNTILAIGILLTGCGEIDVNSYAPVNPVPIIEQNEETVITISLDNVNQEIFGSYYSNYGTFEIENIEYEGYGIGTDKYDDKELFVLRSADYVVDVPILAASFANVEGLDGISTIVVDYESDSDFYILYGNNRNNLKYSYQLPESGNYSRYTLSLVEDASYFRIEAGEGDVYVRSVEIECSGKDIDESRDYIVEGSRYVPKIDYAPYEGEVLSAPICDIDDAGNVKVIDWRDYTYHSFEYARNEVENGSTNCDEYALTEPVDVANYFVLFNRIPPNYGLPDKSQYTRTRIQGDTETVDEVYEVFGPKYTRQVSEYSRTDGYVMKMPVSMSNRTKSGTLYYEFDIDVDGKYSTDKRGTGRVVGFVGGFTTNNDGTNVALYTDDHYYTFAEYNNCGLWNDRFDALSVCRTGRKFDCEEAEELIKIAK